MRPDWDNYFIEIAKVISSRATCIRRRYGAVIVKDNVIISTGYCGAPVGVTNCCDTGICERQRLNIPSGERYELCVSVHAEANAIINAPPDRMKGATIYIAGFDSSNNELAEAKPCLMCRRMIKNSGIVYVKYLKQDGSIASVLSIDL